MRITAWRGFLAAGLVATAGYYLLPDTERVAAASSALALTVALLRLVRTRSRGRDVPALLDALVVSTGLRVVAWQFLMFPYARDPSLSLDQKLTSIVLPLADVVLLAVLVRLWSGGGQRPAALLAAGAGGGRPAGRRRRLRGGHPTRPVLAPGVQMVEWLRGRPIEVPVVAAGSILMFLLIVARTQGLTREVTVQDERRRLLGRVLQATEDERTGIAHDLHDGPVQQLAVLNYDVYRARKRLTDLLGQVTGDALMQGLQGTDEVLEGWRRAWARRPGCCAT